MGYSMYALHAPSFRQPRPDTSHRHNACLCPRRCEGDRIEASEGLTGLFTQSSGPDAGIVVRFQAYASTNELRRADGSFVAELGGVYLAILGSRTETGQAFIAEQKGRDR